MESQYLDGRTSMNCSDVTAAAVDEEVMKLLKSCYKEAKTMIKENRAVMDKIAAHLIEKETITGKEFMEIYCKEKGIPVPVKDDDKKLKKKNEPENTDDKTTEKTIEKAAEKRLEITSESETDVIEKENEEKKKQPEMMDFREVLTDIRKDNIKKEKSVLENNKQEESQSVQKDDAQKEMQTVQNDDSSDASSSDPENEQK